MSDHKLLIALYEGKGISLKKLLRRLSEIIEVQSIEIKELSEMIKELQDKES